LLKLARAFIWFPGINKKLEEVVRSCNKCQINTKKVVYNPFQPSDMPAGPWRELAMDWYGPVWGKYVLILIDRFSRYPLHKIFKNITAKALNLFKPKPSTIGLPNTINDIDMRARKNDKMAKAKQTAYANKRYRTQAHQYRVGDMVRLLQTVKGKSVTTYFKTPGTMATIKRGGIEYARNVSMLKLVESSTNKRRTPRFESEMDAPVVEERENVNAPPESLPIDEVRDIDLQNDDERSAETSLQQSPNAQERQLAGPEPRQDEQRRQMVEEERREADIAPSIIDPASHTNDSTVRRSDRTTKGLEPTRLGINTLAVSEESSDDFQSDEGASN
jgi:hypothetical protein